MKSLLLGFKVSVAFLAMGGLTFSMAEVVNKQNITTTKTITGQGTKKFEDPVFKKEELKKPVVKPKTFEDPVFKKKPVVNPTK